MKPEQWIIEGEVGTSSRTIWAVMTGIATGTRESDGRYYDTPHDPDDFSRCYKLLLLFPGWKCRLSEVGVVFPKWQPYIREWEKLETMYHQWLLALEKYQQEKRLHPRKAKIEDGMSDFMQGLNREGMILDGWIEDSPTSWHRGNQ